MTPVPSPWIPDLAAAPKLDFLRLAGSKEARRRRRWAFGIKLYKQRRAHAATIIVKPQDSSTAINQFFI